MVLTTKFRAFVTESIRSGTIASLVMVPFGAAFRAMDLRVGHYGPKFAEALWGHSEPLLLFAQHLVIGWFSAAPLLWLLAATGAGKRPILAGTLYGTAYYAAVNALALPLAFSDPLPWQLGFGVVYPSLVVHMVFGASIGLTARRFARQFNPRFAAKPLSRHAACL